MTARTAAAASLVLALASAGCLSFYEIAVETPIQAKIDVSPFRRVLVAGFLSGGADNIDPNTETARLLRSQLRSRSDMTVIDADVLPLTDEARRQNAALAGAPMATEADLEAYEKFFDDAAYWKKVGDEYQGALIVTGSVLFREISRSGVFSTPQTYVDPTGRTRTAEQRQYVDQKGFALTPKFVFIDGRTGEQLYSEAFHEETLYASGQTVPALSSYFELMDKVLPSFLNTLSTQKIRGTRFLLK
ncbi:MAG: hypothetical protein R2752_01255 [Vicinamibacterales bacterium]